MSARRIASLLPAATEMICALGLQDALVGRSHECRHPQGVLATPVMMRGVLDVSAMSQAEIDAEITRRLQTGEPIYEIDAEMLAAARPDLLITQELCDVCAASPRDLGAVLAGLAEPPKVLRFTPRSLSEVFGNLRELGAETGRVKEADQLIASLEARIAAVATKTAERARPRVFCMEWLDPPYCSGHWVPEMVEIAGGVDALGRKGTDSVRIAWDEVLAWAPEVLVVASCGYDLDAGVDKARALPELPGWRDLPAVRNGRVFAIDADAYLAKPGPRLVDGLEILAHLLHPEVFGWSADIRAFERLRTKACEACGADFLCRAAAGCWCEGVSLAPGAGAALATRYADCLCPDCLATSGTAA